MEERLDAELTEEKRDQLIQRITDLTRDKILRTRDWIAIYDVLLNACEREEAAEKEKMLEAQIRNGGGKVC